ncbi:MAG: outer membrane protein transport protein [Deltaproteobacteria bacterium]|nr:outer membrane protein transport protein [Deltaproteobacteria bacterium]
MKKGLPWLYVFSLMLSLPMPLLAGGIDNKQNWSAEYMRTLNRNASTDAADVVVYNPAGSIKMENGFYGNVSVQAVSKDFSNTIGGTTYTSEVPSYIPGFFGLYKKDRWAGYFAFTIPGGGGKVKFDDGNATTMAVAQGLLALPVFNTINDQTLEAEGVYYGFTFGGAYAINAIVSVSIGARYIEAQKDVQGAVTVSGIAPARTFVTAFQQNANGWAGIAGINITPIEALNIGIRYETRTPLDFETDVHQDDSGAAAALGFIQGSKTRRDLPATFGLGISYRFIPKLRAETTLTYYLQKNADWNGAEQRVSNGYDLGLAFEYTIIPRLRASLGYAYSNVGIQADDILPENPELDAHTFAGGIVFQARPGLDLNFGVGQAAYAENKNTRGVTFDKNNIFLAFGMNYKFF